MRMHMGAEDSVARGNSLNTLCFCSRTGTGAEQRCYLVINSAALLEALSTMITLKKLTRYVPMSSIEWVQISWPILGLSRLACLLYSITILWLAISQRCYLVIKSQ